MNKNCSLFKISIFSFLSLFFISLSASADLAYMGDTVARKIATRLEGKTLGNLQVELLIDESNRSARISNYQEWLPTAVQGIGASSTQMIILSLGMNDMRLNEYNFPDSATLDAAIASILDNLTPKATVYWVMPHAVAASKQAYYPAQRDAIISAIFRAKTSGKYPGLFLVNVDDWAEFYQINLPDLLTRSKIYFTNNGADLVAGSDLYEMATDYVTPFGTIPPGFFYDGTVRFVDDLDGFNDVAVATAGDTIYIRVDDLDQTSDLNPAQTIRVALTNTVNGDTETVILTSDFAFSSC